MSGRTLVTGATGGLGRVLVSALLAQGREVVATGRNRVIGGVLMAEGARFLPADLIQDDLAGLVEGSTTVFHLAALSRPWGPDAEFVAANVTATDRLLDAARTAGCRRFIHVSTPSIYTRPQDQIGITEATPLPPDLINAYAATKLEAERRVRAAAGPGFATVVLRPRAIISPFDTVLLPRLLTAAGRGVLPLPGGGRALIEPTDARDVTSALFAAEAALPEVSGRAFNISGGQPLSVAAFVSHVFERLGRPVRLVAVPRRLALTAAGANDVLGCIVSRKSEPTLTRYGVMALGWSQTFDLAAAHQALNWRPRHTPLEAVDWALGEMVDA